MCKTRGIQRSREGREAACRVKKKKKIEDERYEYYRQWGGSKNVYKGKM